MMDCTQTTVLSNEAYLRMFNRKALEQCIPLSGSIDVTHRCNLHCVHCYLESHTGSRGDHRKELSTAQWISLLDEITEAGCLHLLITGGEPFLREDFGEIYRHAKTNGLLVTVFTNSTLITGSILELFEAFPPYNVEITVYGATAATYEKITGVAGTYKRCLQGIQNLLDHHISVELKTVLMTHNRHEFFDIERMAKQYGVSFRLDAAISPCLNGDQAPLRLRVSPGEAVEKELSDEERLRQWRDCYERFRGVCAQDMLYTCGAGRVGFYIDPCGILQPCLMAADIRYDLSQGSFLTGWDFIARSIKQKKAGRNNVCNRCDKRMVCGYCPGFFKLEQGKENHASKYLCAMGQHRFQVLTETVATGGSHAEKVR